MSGDCMLLRGVVGGSLAAIVATSAILGAQVVAPDVQPGPLDPLNQVEQALAIQLALSDPWTQGLLREAPEHRVVGAALRVEKPAELGHRWVDVHIYRHGLHDVVWPVIDLLQGGGRVDASKSSVQRFQPALTKEEVLEGKRVLLADPRVVSALEGRTADVEISAILVNPPGTGCALNRCIEAQFVRLVQPNPTVQISDPFQPEVGAAGTEVPVPDLFARYDLERHAVESVFRVGGRP